MKTISSSPTTTRTNRFLKPGALAQIRNSKIIARSHRLGSLAQIPLLRSSAVSQIPAADLEQIPQFIGKIYAGPLCLRRKKVVAPKSVYLLNSNPPATPFINALNHDVLLSH